MSSVQTDGYDSECNIPSLHVTMIYPDCYLIYFFFKMNFQKKKRFKKGVLRRIFVKPKMVIRFSSMTIFKKLKNMIKYIL